MPEKPRFIIGYGERLTEPVPPIAGGGGPLSPYDFATARERFTQDFELVRVEADALPARACPGDQVVTAMTLHPAFIAKSYFPDTLLRSLGLEAVGSRPVSVLPRSVVRRHRDEEGRTVAESVPPEGESLTTELFVSTTRRNLRERGAELRGAGLAAAIDDKVVRVESYHLPGRAERLRVPEELPEEVALEVVLHSGGQLVLDGFATFAEELDAVVDLDKKIDAGGLCFVPVIAPGVNTAQLADFSFVRVLRVMPRLRGLVPPSGTTLRRRAAADSVSLPTEEPIDPGMRAAVFDGGLPQGSCLGNWVEGHEIEGLSDPEPEFLEHGQHVSSALLFGSVDPDEDLPQPYAYVDHFRVLDDRSGEDPYELFDTIRRIEAVMTQSDYRFVNLSIGPDLPIEDDEVHAWTAFWDETLAGGHVLATFAAGNNGELDRASGNARIQVPSDAVNALTVGAATSRGGDWGRAPYSALGPGRSPGVIKPDVIAFGGVGREPFVAIGEDKGLDDTCGTSFAAPSTLRSALGVRALFGDRVTPLAIKALLVHTAEAHDELAPAECGWGRVRDDLTDIVVCNDGEARVLYQGELSPGKYLRAEIPLPADGLKGMVRIRATLAFATDVDPQDPGNYTRSGVEVFFRPHAARFANDDSVNAKTKPFFSKRPFANESELRRDAHKWETLLNEESRFQHATLNQPVFDLHYNARDGGHNNAIAPKIRYAMVITVTAPRVPALYEGILAKYATQLEALTPVLQVPLRVEL